MVAGSWEGADNSPGLGSTTSFNGTVGTDLVSIPSSPGAIIFDAFIRCPYQTPVTRVLYVCLDESGTAFHALRVGESIAASLHGGKTQIKLKANEADVSYEVTLNRVG
jgi:hypothetical protein